MPAEMTDDSAIQERVFEALNARPGVKRIDTHAASVFLDGTRALKIKRAVKFPFINLSALDKRREAFEAEGASTGEPAPLI